MDFEQLNDLFKQSDQILNRISLFVAKLKEEFNDGEKKTV